MRERGHFEQKFQKGPKCTFVWLKGLFLTQTLKLSNTYNSFIIV